MALNIRKHKVVVVVTLALLILSVFACYGFASATHYYFDNVRYYPTAREIFSRYLTYSDNTELLQHATDIHAEELSMGQGVYVRFNVTDELVTDFLEHDQTNLNSYHYPYKITSCQNFYEAYADWADESRGFSWWKPREVTSPECYITRGCEYFLLDKKSDLTYYYYFPDFLGRDYLCVE
jgi:hypothetical protein